MSWLPPLVLLLLSAWAGTFAGGATAAGAAAGAGAVLAMAVVAGLDPDPWRLGRSGRLLLGALLLAVALSAWLSPVPRAGRVILVLLPAWLLLPAAVARCWHTPERLRQGLAGVAVVVAGISVRALAVYGAGASPRTSEPLGHHTLLALWLVTLLPLVLPLLADRSAGLRALGWATTALGVAALVATRSLAGWAALAVTAAALVLWRAARRAAGRRRALLPVAVGPGTAGLALALLALAAAAGPRVLEMLAGRDPSLLARATYWRAGWDGMVARPVAGWGPGSTPWTIAAFLEPRPGVNPPSEVVGQLHSLPLELVYELGLSGLLLALSAAAAFALCRLRQGGGSIVTGAGLLGLLGAAVASLGTAGLAITALPAAAAVAAGTALASGPPRARPPGSGPRWLAAAYGAVALAVLVPAWWAAWSYERAAASATLPSALAHLDRAVELDPSFPLYRARHAWAAGDAGQALRAARDGWGIPPLWTEAGALGRETGAPWAAEALLTACALDPTSPFPPFHLLAVRPGATGAPRWGARALLLEPRLAAATFWDGRPSLVAAVAAEVAGWPGIDPGLREAVAAALVERPGAGGATAQLTLSVEVDPEQPFAPHVFRRIAWPARLAAVPVWLESAGAIDLPSAASLPETSPDAFHRQCGKACGKPVEREEPSPILQGSRPL